jgi:signal transduction histidine kinase
VLRVKDDGCGLHTSSEAPGFGLLGLRERAELLGGTVKLDAVKSGGSVLIVALPEEKYR